MAMPAWLPRNDRLAQSDHFSLATVPSLLARPVVRILSPRYRADADGRRGSQIPAYDPLADGRFPDCPNGRRLWPFWLVRAATGNVRDGKGRWLYPAEDRWIGLVVAKTRPIDEPDDGVDLGDPDSGDPDLPEVTELLEVIADTAGVLEDHIEAMGTSLDGLRPWLPTRSASGGEPADGVRP